MVLFYKTLLSLYARANRQKRKIFRWIVEMARQIMIWLGDPHYVAEIHGKRMLMPVSHKLPIHVIDFPLYDTLPGRVAHYLRSRDGSLTMVDIGANIGDTIVSCYEDLGVDRFLGVEANPEFVPFLKKNTGNKQGVFLVQAFCDSGDEKQARVRIESTGGTARVIEDKNGLLLPKRTLDDILDEYSEFKNFNFLKLDTDGNDFSILKGAQKSIAKAQSIILMECDTFDNINYVDDFLFAVASLEKLGYSTAVVYDNFGNYFCTFPVSNPSSFLDAIAYQIISEFGYFDLLFLCPKYIELIQNEKEFFFLYREEKGLSVALRKAFDQG